MILVINNNHKFIIPMEVIVFQNAAQYCWVLFLKDGLISPLNSLIFHERVDVLDHGVCIEPSILHMC